VNTLVLQSHIINHNVLITIPWS